MHEYVILNHMAMYPISMLSWGLALIQLFFAAFLAITFIESSVNKLINLKGTHDYFADKFKNTGLKGMIGVLLPVIIVMEGLTGLLSVIGFFLILIGNSFVALVASIIAMITFLMLYMGLRISRDYPSAAGLATYIMVTLLGMFFLVF